MSDEQSYEDGADLMFHLASLGASVVPLPLERMKETGEAASMELNMMSGIYRGEDDKYWILDVTSVEPPIASCRLLKDGVDFIGIKSTVAVVRRSIETAS
jgi:hypothetical protein